MEAPRGSDAPTCPSCPAGWAAFVRLHTRAWAEAAAALHRHCLALLAIVTAADAGGEMGVSASMVDDAASWTVLFWSRPSHVNQTKNQLFPEVSQRRTDCTSFQQSPVQWLFSGPV